MLLLVIILFKTFRIGERSMDTTKTKKLMNKYASAMAYIEIEKPDGTKGIGSCFHVGNGVFVTAKHVIEGNIISLIKMTEPVAISVKEYFGDGVTDEYVAEYEKVVSEITKTTPKLQHYQSSLNLKAGPFYHPDPTVDVAIFQVASIHPQTCYVHLGSHLDDWINDSDWRLSEAIVLGYPPIPLTNDPHLVGARAEVNAVVSLYSSKNIHFIISAIPRGGFSGGLVLSEYDFALGLVTQSLVKDYRYEESGFFAVLAIEPIYECLSHYKLLPSIQKVGWDDFWNSYTADYVWKEKDGAEASQLVASIILINDGEKIGIGVCSYDDNIYSEMEALIGGSLIDGYLKNEVHKTYSNYIFEIVTEKITINVHELIKSLMKLCLENGLVTIYDKLTPEITNKSE
jgi:hypothetical protein